jgi:hypothetical protein
MSKKPKKKQKTRRIYCGGPGHENSRWWVVKVSEAKYPVIMNGEVFHALRGYPGVTVGCGLSNIAIDKKNAKAFPHPVFLAAFTKRTALIVDKLKKNGMPDHAVLYEHHYGRITDRNDDGTLKKLVQEKPKLMQRSFTLYPRRKQTQDWTETAGQNRTPPDPSASRAKAFVHRGSLARAVKAGLIGKNVAEHLTGTAPGDVGSV